MNSCEADMNEYIFEQNTRRLKMVLVLTSTYMVVEALGGWLTNSLALLADAGHMLTDVGGLGLALVAMWMADRTAPPEKTYGYYRLEILAAFANAVALVVISLVILYEAYQRFQSPPPVRGLEMMAIAAGGLLVNLLGLWLLTHYRHTNLNVRGAFLHILGDALGSIGAIAAGLAIWLRDWRTADPLFSVATAVLIIYCAWRLLRDSINVLLEATPAHIDVETVKSTMRQVAGVLDIHDLHIWTITPGREALSAHIVLHDGANHITTLALLQMTLKHEFGIDHATLQLETPDFREDEIHF
ncbi:MAG: cation transporter [Acidobacteria bacterium]|nr:cation transporter [Acidobacteriota bacterium]